MAIRVTITATSMIDIGVSDDAIVNIEAPAPTCDFVHGNWEMEIMNESAQGDGEDCWEPAFWFFVQYDCSLTLYDRGREVELEMAGGYAHGVFQASGIQYTYHLHFRDGVEIMEGSGIESLSLTGPTYFQPVRGDKIITH